MDGGPARGMRLVVGLGNPGRRYEQTRHNLGFRVVERLARKLGAAAMPAACDARLYRAVEEGLEWLLACPLTFMNRSGTAVACLIQRFTVPPEAVLVVYDDMALPPGRLRIRRSGTSGSHKGMQSVIECLGTAAVARLRVGIGEPPPGVDGAEWVLAVPPREEAILLDGAIERAAEAVEGWGRFGIDTAMMRYNQVAKDTGRDDA